MIYFDNAASAPVTPAAKEAYREGLEIFANPSSLHRAGFEAEKRIKEARATFAKTLLAEPEEIVFTSGGTESNNMALFGAAKKLSRRGKRLLVGSSEHPSVKNPVKELEKAGFEVVFLSTKGGRLDPAEIAAASDEKTILAVSMHTNNETGAIYDVAMLSRLVKAKNPEALVFCDGVQGYLKTPLSPKALGVDLFSCSSHKIGGPKGVGALYVKKGLVIPPLLYGGMQERGLRSGTENLPAILSFAAAAREGYENLAKNRDRMNAVRERILQGLAGEAKVVFHQPETPSCHILSLEIAGFRSEVLLHTLSQKDIFISSGSACSSHAGKSGVLEQFGLSAAQADRTVRLSFSPWNTPEEAEEFVRVLREIIR